MNYLDAKLTFLVNSSHNKKQVIQRPISTFLNKPNISVEKPAKKIMNQYNNLMMHAELSFLVVICIYEHGISHYLSSLRHQQKLVYMNFSE